MATAAAGKHDSSNPIPPLNFANAIKALLEYINSSNSKNEKSKLFEDDDLIYLILTLHRVPEKEHTKPYQIPVPKPFHQFKSGSTSICLILDDTPKSPLLPESAREEIKARNLPIDHVIGMWELKSDYKAYESRRKLCNSYDLFFADRRIIPMLPRFIGKHFFKTKKIPLPVNFSRVGWADQIKAGCESSLMFIKTGTSLALKIGRVGMSEEDILENALVIIEKAVEHVPKKWGGLRSVHIKTSNSVALPIYQVVPEVGLKIEGVWDEEKKKSLAEGKKKRARDGEGKKERKVKKGRIGDVNGLDEAIDNEVGAENVDDEVAVENGDGDEKKVEEENVGTSAKMKKGKKRKMSVEKNDELEATEVPKKKKAIKGEKRKKKKGNKEEKIESEKIETETSKKKQLKKKEAKESGKKGKSMKVDDVRVEEEVEDEPKEVAAENVDDEVAAENGDGEKIETKTSKKKQLKKKEAKESGKKGKSMKVDDVRVEEEVEDEPKEVAAENVDDEVDAENGDGEKIETKTSKKKQLKKKEAKKSGKKGKSMKVDDVTVEEEVEDEPKEVVCSDSVGKKKKKNLAKKSKSVKSKSG